jgi:hypothetical protein
MPFGWKAFDQYAIVTVTFNYNLINAKAIDHHARVLRLCPKAYILFVFGHKLPLLKLATKSFLEASEKDAEIWENRVMGSRASE